MKLTILMPIALCFLWSCHSEPHSHDTDDHDHTEAPKPPAEPTEILDAQVIPATEFAPEYIQHATNIEIIKDVATASKNASSVFTHEGYFGPLLFGEELRAFSLRLEPGMFLAEHPHPTESIIYTISGKWVLCSEGKRQVMEAGNLFHFGSDRPTGWEAPFAEGALLLIFKKIRENEDYEMYTKGTRDLAQRLDKEKNEGGIFYFDQLNEDHPAVVFARANNPDFDEVLAGLK